MVNMTATYFDTNSEYQPAAEFSYVKAILLEPALIAVVAVFWALVLPFVAVSVACVRVWDSLVAIKTRVAIPSNPLFLSRSAAQASARAFSDRNAVRSGEI